MRIHILLTGLSILGFVLTLSGQVYNNANGTFNTCSGNFYDPGGANSNYAGNLTRTTTFCSNSSNNVVINFSSFNLESGDDFLYVYDGPSTASPLIGAYTGTVIPATFVSSGTCLTFRFTSDNNVHRAGWEASISCASVTTFNMNSGNSGGTTSSCGVLVFDNGGTSGNYSNSQDYQRTFCSSSTGCMEINLLYLRTLSGFFGSEGLTIYDGPTTSSPIIYECLSNCNVAGTIQATGSCVTFRFRSNGSNTDDGFSAYLTCKPCPLYECSNGSTVCGDATLTGSSSGFGYQELDASSRGCLSGENQSSWYLFSPQTAGTVAFVIDPTGSEDYDFAVWGPFASGSQASSICPPTSNPARCSWAAGNGNTGLLAGAGDNSEGAAGNGYVNPLNVSAGDVYLLMIDNYSANNNTFTLNWNLAGGASLDCTVLPVEFLSFTGEAQKDGNFLTWYTASEQGNQTFFVERSQDGLKFESLASLPGAGNSHITIGYAHLDRNPNPGTNYYRIRQQDFDGKTSYSDIIAIRRAISGDQIIKTFPNPATDQLTVEVSGLKENVTVILRDVTGKVIGTEQLPSSSTGTVRQVISTANFSRGLVFLSISTPTEGIVHTEKVILE